jgi:hypothetical protein
MKWMCVTCYGLTVVQNLNFIQLPTQTMMWWMDAW